MDSFPSLDKEEEAHAEDDIAHEGNDDVLAQTSADDEDDGAAGDGRDPDRSRAGSTGNGRRSKGQHGRGGAADRGAKGSSDADVIDLSELGDGRPDATGDDDDDDGKLFHKYTGARGKRPRQQNVPEDRDDVGLEGQQYRPSQQQQEDDRDASVPSSDEESASKGTGPGSDDAASLSTNKRTKRALRSKGPPASSSKIDTAEPSSAKGRSRGGKSGGNQQSLSASAEVTKGKVRSQDGEQAAGPFQRSSTSSGISGGRGKTRPGRTNESDQEMDSDFEPKPRKQPKRKARKSAAARGDRFSPKLSKRPRSSAGNNRDDSDDDDDGSVEGLDDKHPPAQPVPPQQSTERGGRIAPRSGPLSRSTYQTANRSGGSAPEVAAADDVRGNDSSEEDDDPAQSMRPEAAAAATTPTQEVFVAIKIKFYGICRNREMDSHYETWEKSGMELLGVFREKAHAQDACKSAQGQLDEGKYDDNDVRWEFLVMPSRLSGGRGL